MTKDGMTHAETNISWDEQMEALSKRIATLSDDEAAVRIREIAASIGEGETITEKQVAGYIYDLRRAPYPASAVEDDGS